LAAKQPQNARKVFTTALCVLSWLVLPAMALTYAALPVLLTAQSSAIISEARLFLLLIPLQILGTLPWWILHGIGNLKLWNILRLQFPAIWLIALLFVSGRKLDAAIVSRLYLLAMTLTVIPWNLALIQATRGDFRFDAAEVKSLFQFGVPSVLTGLPQYLNLRLDQLVMAAYLAPGFLGLYVTGVAWSGLINPAMTAVSQVVFPKVVSIENEGERQEVIARVMRSSVLAGLLLSLTLVLITPHALPRIYGQRILGAVTVTQVLIVAALFSNLNLTMQEVFRALGRPRVSMQSEFLGLAVTVIGLFLLLPKFGLLGAAFASLFSYVTVFAWLTRVIVKDTNTSIRRLIVPSMAEWVYLWESIPFSPSWPWIDRESRSRLH
jgi:O-antigen/teichoic acid export membrane protein